MTNGAPPRDRVYRRADLQRVLHPRSIAIVGASARQGAFGERVLNNLAGYAGNVHLVNPKSDWIGERACHPNLSALPESPDCVVVCVPREGVEEVVLEAAKVRAGGVIIFASGYAETGKPERVAQQARLSQLAAESGMRILGPNCLGIGNYALGARITFSEYPARAAAARGLRRHREPVGCAVAVARAVDRNRRLGEPHLFGRQPGRRRRRRPRCLSRGGGRVSLDRLRVRGHVAAATVARGGGSRVAQRQAAADPQDRDGATRFRSRCLAHRHARGLERRVPRCVRARGRDPDRGLRGADGGGCVLREGAAA